MKKVYGSRSKESREEILLVAFKCLQILRMFQ